ncbi:MAG: vWA domain-containing protein [Gemmatimonadales bacterium]
MSKKNVNHDVEPWSTGHSEDQFGVAHFTRPWYAPENQGVPKTYKHPSVVFPPCYDTNFTGVPIVQVVNVGTPPVVNFNDVPASETAVRAAIFRAYGCGNVTIRVKTGAGPVGPFAILHPPSGAVIAQHGANIFAESRIWLSFTAGAAGVPVTDGSVTFECPENGKEFTFVLKANAISRPTVAVMMALDQSGSMAWAAGTSGATRMEVLKDAARKFMELIQQDNGVGLIRFDHNSYSVNDPVYPGLAVTKITSNNMFDVGRVAAINAVNNHNTNPAGNTSVGDGVDRARQVLNALPAGGYDDKALILLTDGLENEPLWIADVAGAIDSRTFAIGLGSEGQVNTAALRALANGSGGNLLLTGVLGSSIDDYFRLSKYFLQILAGVTNTSIVLDPMGYLAPGATIRIPFYLTEADIDCTALLLTDENVVDIALEAPDGTPMTAAMAPGLGMSYGIGEQTRSYRFTLPVAVGAGQQAGVWHAVLAIDHRDFKKALSRLRDHRDQRLFQSFATHGARYSVAIHTYSNLRMAARVEQTSFEPGATLTFQAILTEYGIPVERRAQAYVELTRPGGLLGALPLTEIEPGIFEGSTAAPFAGIYHARIMAKGVTLRGTPFTREQAASAAVWKGGDDPYQPPRDSDTGDLCRLLACLLNEKSLSRECEQQLKRVGVNLGSIRDCVAALCRSHERTRAGR